MVQIRDEVEPFIWWQIKTNHLSGGRLKPIISTFGMIIGPILVPYILLKGIEPKRKSWRPKCLLNMVPGSALQ